MRLVVRRERAALGSPDHAAAGDERLMLATGGDPHAPPRAGYARSLHGGARTFAFEAEEEAASSSSADDAPMCRVRLAFDRAAVVGIAEHETVVAPGDWIKLLLHGAGLALVDAPSSGRPGARRTEVEDGRPAYLHARVERASVDGADLEVRALLSRRCPAATTAAHVQYVGATGPWRDDLARVDAGAVVAALVAEREVMDERIAALESAVEQELSTPDSSAFATLSATGAARQPTTTTRGSVATLATVGLSSLVVVLAAGVTVTHGLHPKASPSQL